MASEKLIQSLQRRLQILEDKDAIVTLLNTYCTSADRHDWEAWADTFSDDGELAFEEWGAITGRDKMINVSSTAENRFEGLQHSMTNMEIVLEGSDTAIATSYLWFAATPKTSQPEVNYAFGGKYNWKFKRTPKGWKIRNMHLKKLWAQGEDTEGVFTGATVRKEARA